jgi:hypothetical protein
MEDRLVYLLDISFPDGGLGRSTLSCAHRNGYALKVCPNAVNNARRVPARTPLPANGMHCGACSGYVVDHVKLKPLWAGAPLHRVICSGRQLRMARPKTGSNSECRAAKQPIPE